MKSDDLLTQLGVGMEYKKFLEGKILKISIIDETNSKEVTSISNLKDFIATRDFYKIDNTSNIIEKLLEEHKK